MTALHDRLDHVTDLVGSGHPVPEPELLWRRGHRWRARRRAGAGLVVGSALGLVVGLAAVVGLPSSEDRTVPPADVPFEQLHLPRTVHPPSPWAAGSAESGAPGPLAAIGQATRLQRDGLTGERESAGVYGVSAVDGSVRWLDLPGADVIDSFFGGWLALSPDGTKVGYVVADSEGADGYAVYDALTGRTTQLRDPEQDEIRGMDAFTIEFSGDSRYLQTTYSLTGSEGSRDHSFVIWDAETAERIVVEGAGEFWLPDLGSSPDRIMWSRQGELFTYDPATGETSTRDVPARVVTWSVGPGGREAYIDRGERNQDDWRLLTGNGRVVRGVEPVDQLWWRDADTVVVPDVEERVSYVDLRSGAVVGTERLEVAEDGRGLVLTVPLYADDLWANDLVDGVEPPSVADPRINLSDVALVAVPALAVGSIGLVLWRRRVRP
jgi:hypothetical protein